MLSFTSPLVGGCPTRVHPFFRQACGLGRAARGVQEGTETVAYQVSPARMQLPPHPGAWTEPPLTDEQRGPDTYKWDPDYQGTIHPGLGEPDCFPLDEVMNSGVYERMVYQELDRYERSPELFQPDEDLLEWLVTVDRLLPRDVDDAELELEAEKQVAGITEEDLEFGEEDSRTLAYYSRQGEGSSLGASPDFGGLAESGLESMLE